MESSSENSSSTSEETFPSSIYTDDNILHQELAKIMDILLQQIKHFEYRFSTSRIENDMLAFASDKINFPTANPPQRWEGHIDEDASEAVILIAATTRSVILVAEDVTGKLQRLLKQLGNLDHSGFSAKESKTKKRICMNPFHGVKGAKQDNSVAETEKDETIQRDLPKSSKMEAKSDEIGGRLMRFFAEWAAVRAEIQVMLGIMPLQTRGNSKQILKNLNEYDASEDSRRRKTKRINEKDPFQLLSRGSIICLLRHTFWTQTCPDNLHQNLSHDTCNYQKESLIYISSILG
ncbi:MAG: hypothetical protein EZS28_023272 [Streblomastix strix]|uniref:Uncharacterized protein n=1 Tax=Streblomastix strix TaxID=222440 RepID=A0A5J4VFG7_9EUKA|nr:MAG: hypothetical protein EZS28_023272 [Streblomastix strix]